MNCELKKAVKGTEGLKLIPSVPFNKYFNTTGKYALTPFYDFLLPSGDTLTGTGSRGWRSVEQFPG